MTDNHPITPPPTLVKQWVTEVWHEGTPARLSLSDMHIATEAARWGSDQELRACCVLMDKWGLDGEDLVECRRPKPPSLADQALEALNRGLFGVAGDADTILRALERLQELEGNG